MTPFGWYAVKQNKNKTKQKIFSFIIMKEYWQYRLPWLSLVIHPYQLLLFVSYPNSIQCLHRADECKFFVSWPTLLCPCVVVHRTFMSSSLFFQQSPACLVIGKWPYNSFQDLFKTAYNMLFPPGFFSEPFIWVQMVQPYNSTDMTTA